MHKRKNLQQRNQTCEQPSRFREFCRLPANVYLSYPLHVVHFSPLTALGCALAAISAALASLLADEATAERSQAK